MKSLEQLISGWTPARNGFYDNGSIMDQAPTLNITGAKPVTGYTAPDGTPLLYEVSYADGTRGYRSDSTVIDGKGYTAGHDQPADIGNGYFDSSRVTSPLDQVSVRAFKDSGNESPLETVAGLGKFVVKDLVLPSMSAYNMANGLARLSNLSSSAFNPSSLPDITDEWAKQYIPTPEQLSQSLIDSGLDSTKFLPEITRATSLLDTSNIPLDDPYWDTPNGTPDFSRPDVEIPDANRLGTTATQAIPNTTPYFPPITPNLTPPDLTKTMEDVNKIKPETGYNKGLLEEAVDWMKENPTLTKVALSTAGGLLGAQGPSGNLGGGAVNNVGPGGNTFVPQGFKWNKPQGSSAYTGGLLFGGRK